MSRPTAISPEQLRLHAEAIVAERKRAGTWSGAVRPHIEYQQRPLDWMVEKLGISRESIAWSLADPDAYAAHQWDGDRDPLVKAFDALVAWKSAGIESATGTGKTYAAALLTLWFLACFENSIVIHTAPKSDQLLLGIWKYIGQMFPAFKAHFPTADLITGKLRIRPDEGGKETWAATAIVAGVGAAEELAGRAKGMHAPDMLIITEETQSQDPAIMKSLRNTRTDDHNLHLAIGNPDHQDDQLHRFCFDEHGQPVGSVVHIRISAFDHPNVVTGRRVVEGAIGKLRLEERMIEDGPPTSRIYLSQIRGLCPKEPEEALIRWEWCVAASKKFDDPNFRDGALALGIDVADSPTGDKAAISRWQGACCTEVQSFRVQDASEVGQRVWLEATDKENPVDPRYIGIDRVGVGASAVNELKRLGLRVRLIGGGDKAVPGLDKDLLWSETQEVDGKLKPTGPRVTQAERHDNLRSQVWWMLREDLRLGRIAIPNDEELWKDICAPVYGTPNNKISVESKDTIRARIGRSPDKGDALAYGNFVRRRTPLRTDLPSPKVSRNEDFGLERIMARHRQRQEAEERRLKRFLAQRKRDRDRERGRR